MTACTIVAHNYLAFARVLAHSYFKHHPGGRFVVLLVDDEDRLVDDQREPFEVLRPTDIGFTAGQIHRLAMLYDVTEFSTALKPQLMRHLLLEGLPAVLYLDPDIWVHAPLDDLAELARDVGIVLTPHRTFPLDQQDRKTPSETDLLSAGVFNLGFIAIGPGAERFLEWWSDHVRFDAIRDIENNLFTDQRWIDMVPGYFSHSIVRDEGCNVAYWNLDTRDVVWTGSRYEVNGAPLRFFHFSGFRPDSPELLTTHHGDDPRILLSKRPSVARLCREYATLVLEARSGVATTRYGYDVLPNGIRTDVFMRRLYRDAVRHAENDSEVLPPDPFDPSSADAFLVWLNAPLLRGVSRYLHQIYIERPEVQARFPLVPGRHAQAFLEWARTWGRREYHIPDALLPDPAPRSAMRPGESTSRLTQGVNVAGYFRAEMGVGEAGRAVLRAVEAAGLPHRTVLEDRTLGRQEHPYAPAKAGAEEAYDTNIVCVNADELPRFVQAVGPGFFRSRYTIGMWHWEVEEFPEQMHAAFRHVDEVWMASEFSRQAVAKVAPCPVLAFPLPVVVPLDPPHVPRSELGLPHGFVFLFVFDYFSVFRRKNPIGVVEAFRRAFPSGGPSLVLKSINGDRHSQDRERLLAVVGDDPDIHVIDGYLDDTRRLGLMATCDCYVSLHRAEGFGLTLAEAMSLGKPVIATGYSGNLDFMTESNSFLVPYSLVPIGSEADPYPAEARWAEPDLDAAAAAMRRVYEDPKAAAAHGDRARSDIERHHSPDARAAFVKQRVENARRLRTLQLRRTDASSSLTSGSRLRDRAKRAGARLALRALNRPIEALRSSTHRYRYWRTVGWLRRVLRRRYRALWRIGSDLDE